MYIIYLNYFLPHYLAITLCPLQLKAVARAYFEEARWFNEGYTPTMEEYLPAAIVSTGYPMLSTVSLLGMGDIVTKDIFEWLFNDAKIVRASTTLFRFMDDIVTSKV